MMIAFSKSKPPFSALHRVSRTLIIGFFALGSVIISVDAGAQDVDISGTAWVTDWPETRPARRSGESAPALDYSRYNLLPFIDSLAIHYRFSAISSASEFLSMHFAIEWTEGQDGIVAGRKVGINDMPPGIVIESIDLLMHVTVGNEPVADFFLPLDTIGLGPAPSRIFIDITDVAWNSVFVDVDEEEARRIFESDFRLSTPRIVRAVFATEPPDEYQIAATQGAIPSIDPFGRTVFIPDIDIWIGWRDGRGRWAPPPGTVRKTGRDGPREMGRARLAGRTRVDRGYDRSKPGGTERSPTETPNETALEDNSRADASDSRQDGDTSQKGRDATAGRDGDIDLGDLFKSKNNDDDNEKDRLLPGALAGMVAIGGLAVLGGTIGYFGSASKAPIGLMSGYVESDGGLLLQVAINRQVFGKEKGSENLIASLTGFYNVFDSRIQPAIGIGTRITEEGTDEVVFEPSVSIGVVGNFGQFVLLVGYDVTTPDFRFGIAVNLRHAR